MYREQFVQRRGTPIAAKSAKMLITVAAIDTVALPLFFTYSFDAYAYAARSWVNHPGRTGGSDARLLAPTDDSYVGQQTASPRCP